MTRQKAARLRVCASCEWIFRLDAKTEQTGCPECGFAHYGARFVYGDDAYRYAKSQQPWRSRKMAAYAAQLDQKIQQTTQKGHPSGINLCQ